MMEKTVILRPVWNRPEMLFLSIESEIKARKCFEPESGSVTIFVVEYGAPIKILKILEDYPFEKEIIIRKTECGLTKNILEGMKTAFNTASDYIIYLEDDILLHETYFKFMTTFVNLIKAKIGKFSYLSSGSSPNADPCKVSRCKGYSALAPIISKEFFIKYIEPCAVSAYYDDRWQFILDLSKKHQHNKAWIHGVTKRWNEQAGLISRLVNIAEFEENMYPFGHSANRQMHIGFYGKNRKGSLTGENFEKRLKKLRYIITSSKKMYDATKSKEYNDYKTFSPNLDSWDGSLTLT